MISTMTLNNGKYVVIFDSDMEWEIKKHSWHVNNNGYVACNGKTIGYNYMHQFVLDFAGDGKTSPDHINRVKTDNRRSNLRIISQHENVKNRVIRNDKLNGVCVTENEIDFLRFAINHTSENNVFPSYKSLIKGMGFKSPHSVTQYLKSCVSKELLVRDKKQKYIPTQLAMKLCF